MAIRHEIYIHSFLRGNKSIVFLRMCVSCKLQNRIKILPINSGRERERERERERITLLIRGANKETQDIQVEEY